MPRKIIGIFIAASVGFLLIAAVGSAVVYHFVRADGGGNAVAWLSPEPRQSVKVFFGNSNLNPGAMDCSLVYPVGREIVSTVAPGRASIEELLKGPTTDEANGGYYTSINPGAALRTLTIKDGVARADFDSRIEEGVGGSCRVTEIRSQITRTLLQFGTVKSVVISVDGRTEDALQP